MPFVNKVNANQAQRRITLEMSNITVSEYDGEHKETAEKYSDKSETIWSRENVEMAQQERQMNWKGIKQMKYIQI